jgi:phenylalanyl-tRNA synthetase beta chain
VEAILRELRIPGVRFSAVSDNPSYHPGRCAAVRAYDTDLGVMGQVHPFVCEAFGIDCEVVAVELDLLTMMSCRGPEPIYKPLPRFPAVTRDLAVVCGKDVPAAALLDVIAAAGGPTLEDCRLFDVYTGAPIPEGKRSLAFSLSLRAADQTLTDEHAEETVSKILEALNRTYGAVIR